MSEQISEQLTIVYHDAEHRKYALLLLRYGFDMTISSTFRVGWTFKHPQRQHIVELDLDTDGTIEAKLLIWKRNTHQQVANALADYDIPMVPDDYTQFEWDALQGDRPDDYTFLERELHVWFKVRPHTLRSQLKLDRIES